MRAQDRALSVYVEDLGRRILGAVRAGEDAAATALSAERAVVRARGSGGGGTEARCMRRRRRP